MDELMVRRPTRRRADLFGRAELAPLINPASVAVIGASNTPGSFGNRALENIDVGYDGTVYAINPKYDVVRGVPAFPTIADTPEPPQCALISVPRAAVMDQLRMCAERGVKGAIVFSSGFAEVGSAEGIADQTAMADLARDSGMRIVGPNCVGIINVRRPIGMTFMPKFYEMPMLAGSIGVVSQSGALGYVILQALMRGVPFSHYLSPGNSCDVDVLDLVNYLVEDPDVATIAATFEGVRDGDRLVEVGRRALAAGKPLIVFKLAHAEASRKAALSHTGTLAGGREAYLAAFAEAGAVVVDDFEALLETADFFQKAGAPTARGVGIMASSGGAAVMGADKAEDYGLHLPAPAPATHDVLARVIPDFGSTANPCDLTAESLKSLEMYGDCIRAFAEDPSYGAVVVPMMSAHAPVTIERAAYLSDLARDLPAPMCLVWLTEWLEGPGSREYDSSRHIATFRSMGRCFATLRRWHDWHDARAALLAPREPRASDPACADEARRLLREAPAGPTLSEAASKRLLALYGLPVPREALARSPEEAAALAQDIGFPVVMKVQSPDIAHKSEAGAIRLGIADAAAARAAFEAVTTSARAYAPQARIDGVSVQETAPKGVELMIGTRRDPQFGPLVVCGLGGVWVELLKDVSVALAPVGKATARRMLRRLRGAPLLDGFRGAPRVDEEALVDAIRRVSELAFDLGDIVDEIDVNPVFAFAGGIMAADALVARSGGKEGQT